MRRFMQTFVLGPHSLTNYYIYNDIFRYQDEVTDCSAISIDPVSQVFSDHEEAVGSGKPCPPQETEVEAEEVIVSGGFEAVPPVAEVEEEPEPPVEEWRKPVECQQPDSPAAATWHCQICGEEFVSKRSRKNHVRKHHVVEAVKGVEAEGEGQDAPGPEEEQDKAGAVLEVEAEVEAEVEVEVEPLLGTPDLAEAWPGLAEGADRPEQEVKVTLYKTKY
jgi:hypothetical protein